MNNYEQNKPVRLITMIAVGILGAIIGAAGMAMTEKKNREKVGRLINRVKDQGKELGDKAMEKAKSSINKGQEKAEENIRRASSKAR